jgi:hypothetical protein
MPHTKERRARYEQDDLRVIPWRVWCAQKGISVDTGRRLRESGKAPRIIHISERRLGVTVADDREWTLARIQDGA